MEAGHGKPEKGAVRDENFVCGIAIKVLAYRMVYEKLAAALSEEEQVVYRQRVDELSPSLRYCAYNVGDETAIDDLLKMRGTGQGDLLANLDVMEIDFCNS